MSDSKKDRRDVRDRVKDKGKGWTREKSRFSRFSRFEDDEVRKNVGTW